MDDKKHIDKLFQDGLRDFEATPSDVVWENISAKLNYDGKERKAIPLWWKIAGVAASLALLLTLGNALLNKDNAPVDQQNVVDTKSDSETPNTENDDSTLDLNSVNEDTNVVTDNSNDQKNQSDDVIDSDSNNESNQLKSNSNNLVSPSNNNKDKVTVASQNTIQNKKDATTNDKKSSLTKDKDRTNNAVAQNKSTDQFDKTNTNFDKQKTNALAKNITKDIETSVTGNDKEKEDAIIESSTKNKETAIIGIDKEKNDAVTQTEVEETDKLSIAEELEKLQEAEDAIVEEDDLNKKRWSVAPNIAPVYFNSFGSGSSIDDKFNQNSKTGDINMSYGVGAAYAINDKLSVRAGVNQVKLGYSTNDVIVYNNIEPVTITDKPLKNVRLNAASQQLSFLSADGLNFAQVPGVVSGNIESSIDQKLGFIEIPLELEYKISEKKLGISVIGGFSTLFLNENEVYSSLQGERQLLGEATNINKTSFSANLGLGFTLKVSEKLNLNLEPVLKYQLNTFNDTSGSFNPYILGVYTGLSFKF